MPISVICGRSERERKEIILRELMIVRGIVHVISGDMREKGTPDGVTQLAQEGKR
jgi:hypothetical protein